MCGLICTVCESETILLLCYLLGMEKIIGGMLFFTNKDFTQASQKASMASDDSLSIQSLFLTERMSVNCITSL